MAETSRGGIKKNGQVRGGTANGRKYVKTERKSAEERAKDARKETNSRGNKARVQANSGKANVPATRASSSPAAPRTPSATGVARQTGTQVATQSRAVGGLGGTIAPRNPGTIAPRNPGTMAPSNVRASVPATPQGYTQSFGQPTEGMRDVGSGRSAGAANPRAYSTSAQTAPGATGAPQQLSGPQRPGMTAGPRPTMSAPSSRDVGLMGAVGRVLSRWAGPASAAAAVMAPSPTNQGEAEWIAAGRPAQGMGGNVQSQGSMGGGAQAAQPTGSMGMGSSAPRPSAGGGMGATAANALQSSMGGTMGRPSAPGSMTGQAPQQGSMGGGQAPMQRPPNGSQPVGGQQRPRQSVPTTGPDPMSIDAKIAQLVQKGFSREDALKLASAQGGKVNAPQGYARGGMVKAPGMPRMPKTPDTGKKGTATKVMPAISKAMKPKAPKKVK